MAQKNTWSEKFVGEIGNILSESTSKGWTNRAQISEKSWFGNGLRAPHAIFFATEPDRVSSFVRPRSAVDKQPSFCRARCITPDRPNSYFGSMAPWSNLVPFIPADEGVLSGFLGRGANSISISMNEIQIQYRYFPGYTPIQRANAVTEKFERREHQRMSAIGNVGLIKSHQHSYESTHASLHNRLILVKYPFIYHCSSMDRYSSLRMMNVNDFLELWMNT